MGGFVREFLCRTLLPKLEDRIARLNASITAARRGLRNRLNRFWKGAAEDRQTDRCASPHCRLTQHLPVTQRSALHCLPGIAPASPADRQPCLHCCAPPLHRSASKHPCNSPPRPYPWHSVEGQMRQLGDLAFLMRQYPFAESTYRLAAQVGGRAASGV